MKFKNTNTEKKHHAISGVIFISLLFALSASTKYITELVIVDFVNINNSRTLSLTFETALVSVPFFSIIYVICTFIVFSIPLFLQNMLLNFIKTKINTNNIYIIIATTPLISIITWYCYDYLTPTDVNLGFNVGQEYKVFEHGITPIRYLEALTYQTTVSIYCLFIMRLKNEKYYNLKRYTKLILIFISIVIGLIMGHRMAEEQYRYL